MKNKLKIYFNTGFEGHYPIGTSSIVIATSKKKAKKYLDVLLAKESLKECEEDDFEVFDFKDGNALILDNGDY
jgi:hypothetical protein